MRKERTSSDKDVRSRRTAAQWFVELDRDRMSARETSELAAWLADSRNEEALARCQAAALLTPALRERSGLRWAFQEATELATGRAPGRRFAPARRWYQRAGLAWAVAGVALAVAVAATLRPSAQDDLTQAARASAEQPLAAAGSTDIDLIRLLAIDVPPQHPVALLPGEVIVDARSVAVLPFSGPASEDSDGGGDRLAEIAAALDEQIVRSLAELPGVYVVARELAAGYARVELAPEDIALQLGVRGVVEGRVERDAERVLLHLRLTDAVNESVIERTFDQPIEFLAALQTEVTQSIAVALSTAPRPEARPAPLEPFGEVL